MRAVAIGIVIISHLGADRFVPGGFGVTLFFFISGYLITGLLIQEKDAIGKIAIPSFYMRRFLRLGPALIAMIAIVSIVYYLLFSSISYSQILAGLLYYTNFYEILGKPSPLPLGPLWSLAVEEHYYLIYPLIFAVSWKRREGFLAGLVVLTVIVLLWRVALIVYWQAPAVRTYVATDTRIDSILYGAILAVLPHTRFSGIARYFEHWAAIAIAVLTLLLTFLYRDPSFRETFRYSLQGIAILPLFYSLLFFPQFSGARSILTFPPIVWIGQLSYSLYLYHFPILFFVPELLPNVGSVSLISVELMAAIAAASFSFYCIERPFRKLRDRYRGTGAKDYAAPNALRIVPPITSDLS